MVNLHVHVIPSGVWNDYVHVIRGREGWDDILSDYSIQLVVTDRSQHGPLILELRRHAAFRPVFSDSQTEIFLRGGTPD